MSDRVAARFGLGTRSREGRCVLIVGSPKEAEMAVGPALAAAGIQPDQVFRIRDAAGLDIQYRVARAICAELGVRATPATVFRHVNIAMHALRSAGKTMLHLDGPDHKQPGWCSERRHLEEFCIFVMERHSIDVIVNGPPLRKRDLRESRRFLRRTQIVTAGQLLGGHVHLDLGTL